MNKKQRKTLGSIFDKPTRADIPWTNIESLLYALGAELSEGRGSRIRIKLNVMRAVFHPPHPRKETTKGAVEDLREFLEKAGIRHDEI